MPDPIAWLIALGPMAALALAGWLYSLRRDDVSIVDVLWALFFLIAAIVYFAGGDEPGGRPGLVLALVALWSLRLSTHIALRNRGKGEDYRYRTIRENNEPGFRYKSLVIIFGLQCVLAWIISLPLLAAIRSGDPLNVFDLAGIVLFAIGLVFEWGGDRQLARFRGDPANAGKVLDTGLWRYTRHPNYFGNCCIWWSFYLFALAAGGWITVISPLIMTVLLLKVSGVALLEKTIGERRPGYAEYVRRTNAFIPGPPKAARSSS